ncbi:UNVERIFIED_CONTAM: peptidoglycan/LPS O-acetylase OafA/YrhL [Jeotgalibacillus campisalis]
MTEGPDSVSSMPSPSRLWIPAAIADLLLILVFAAIGRDAHARGDIVSGAFATAWPFLTGAAIAWVVTRAWRAPLAAWPSGVCIWIGAVLVGMLLRAVTGQTVVLPFVLVALISLGVFLLGYRVLATLLLRASRKRQRRA